MASPLVCARTPSGIFAASAGGPTHHRIVFQFGEKRFAFALGDTRSTAEQGLGPLGFFNLSAQPTVSPIAALAGTRVESN